MRTGCPWRDLPSEFGGWNTVFKRFRRWVKADAFYRIFRALAEDAAFEFAMIDGTFVRSTVTDKAQKGDSKPGHRALSWRDSQQDHGPDRRAWHLIDFRLLGGQAHDLRGTAALFERLNCGHLLADRAFDANWLRNLLTSAGIAAVIPPKSNRRFPANFDRDSYKWRHLIENFFGEFKEYRGIAMRCCKTDESFSAFISLAATIIRTR